MAGAPFGDRPTPLFVLRVGLRRRLRLATHPGTRRVSVLERQHLEQHYQARLAEALPGTNTNERAALLIWICAGIQLMKNVLKISVLQNASTDRLTDYLEAALDNIAYERDTANS